MSNIYLGAGSPFLCFYRWRITPSKIFLATRLVLALLKSLHISCQQFTTPRHLPNRLRNHVLSAPSPKKMHLDFHSSLRRARSYRPTITFMESVQTSHIQMRVPAVTLNVRSLPSPQRPPSHLCLISTSLAWTAEELAIP